MTYRIRTHKRGWLQVDITLRLPDGTTIRDRRKSPVAGKPGTERWAKAREGELLAQGLAPKASKRRDAPTLSTFWPRFIRDHSRANQQKESGIESKMYHYRQFLAPVLGAVRLDDINNAMVAKLKGYMVDQFGARPTHKSKKGRAATTVNNCLSSLSKCLRCAMEWGVIDVMPCTIARLKTQTPAIRFYEFDEYESLVAAAEQLDPRVHIAVLLGGDAGLRRGEIIALDQADCDTRGGRLTIQRSEWQGKVTATKGMETRVVPMTDRLRAAIKASKHLRGRRLLYTDAGTTVTARTLRTWMAAAQKAAKHAATSGALHILRHTFCSHLAMKGAPVLSIQKLAGHKHLATTLRYMHLSSGETERAIGLLGRGAGNHLATAPEPANSPSN